MLIAFEGQDGAGKSSLIQASYTKLRSQGVPAIVAGEFSDSPYGQRLVDAVARDKFLRPVAGEPATVVSRALEVVADLYYFDERVIAPALEAGHVVLKDRHIDTIFSTLVPTLIQAGVARDESRALTWLSIMLNKLRYRPAVTVYVDAPPDLRLARIRQRPRHFQEDRAQQVSREDVQVFAARERVIRQLMATEPMRFVTVDNARPLSEGVSQVLALVTSRRF